MSYLSGSLLVIGSLFIFLAGLGLFRMRTLFTRMQVTSKASTLGVVCMICGVSLRVMKLEVATKGILICALLILTTPIATHALALAAKKRGCDR
ncbi:MAG: monovalent cation/H(+) antiporter subunit G [Bdellovibrionaceae bacterium]|nr:monovalent cation/H(+) antiporter subunit G [Bdellovibrionales bacterium]MCB9255048.1 monovalent cation/H(+) antiporter subunit G [Pseudobdellovibrionaceae bacterium]